MLRKCALRSDELKRVGRLHIAILVIFPCLRLHIDGQEQFFFVIGKRNLGVGCVSNTSSYVEVDDIASPCDGQKVKIRHFDISTGDVK